MELTKAVGYLVISHKRREEKGNSIMMLWWKDYFTNAMCFLTIGDHFLAQVWFCWSEIDYRVPFKFFTMSGVHVQLQKSWGNLESMSWKEKLQCLLLLIFFQRIQNYLFDIKLFYVIWTASRNVFVQFTHWFFTSTIIIMSFMLTGGIVKCLST